MHYSKAKKTEALRHIYRQFLFVFIVFDCILKIIVSKQILLFALEFHLALIGFDDQDKITILLLFELR